MKKGYLYIGIFLLLLYIMQAVFEWLWAPLYDLQQLEGFKRWSGLGLFIYITIQWTLTIFRTKKSWEHNSPLIMEIHKWMGAFSPVVFYIHSMVFGYAYLLILSLTFFANVLIGFVNLDVIKTKAYWYFQTWMITHVAFSLAISLIAIYHIWIVFYYN